MTAPTEHPRESPEASEAQGRGAEGVADVLALDPIVTVVVPCYRQAHFLTECLESIQAQTLPNWRAIVVDDASPDGGAIAKVVEEIGDPRIRLIRHEENRGLGGSRNTGIRAAETEYVYPLDSDDRITPDCLERLVGELEADPTLDCAYADVQLFGRLTYVLEFPGPPEGRPMVRTEHTIPGAGTMLRKSFWEKVGGYDEADVLRSGREDFEFWVRAFAAGCNAKRLLEPVYEYRILHASMSVNCRRQDDAIAAYIYEKHRALFDETGEANGFLCSWYEQASYANYIVGDRRRAFDLALRSFRKAPSRRRLKQTIKALFPFSLNRAIAEGSLHRAVPFLRYPLRGEERQRPFFVIGVGRSGNTLFRRILTSHSQLHVPPESFVLGACIRKYRAMGSKMNWPDLVSFVFAQFQFHPEFHLFEMDLEPLVTRLSQVAARDRNLAYLFDAFYREHAAQHGKTPLYWGDKTPMNSLDDRVAAGDRPKHIGQGVPQTLERIRKVFPDARFLHIYRDGCDCVLSHLRGGFFASLEDAANRWRHVESQTRRFAERYRSQSLDVRYEDLVSNPREVVEGVCSFLGVPFEEAMLESESNSKALGDVPAWSWHAQVAKPINAKNPGKARRVFTAEERERLQALIGDELAAFGYPPATADPE
ncbi:MAG TPA: glycosyltransferase [Planctomycetes bacterium]|nr:glycosyltransferase [Planctomycetota bacterium]